jgi:O-methyltransferase
VSDEASSASFPLSDGKELWDEELSKHFEHYWYNARKKIDLRCLDGFGEIAVRIHDDGNTYLHLDRLYTLWQAVTTMPPARAIVEIGTYQGGSAKFVAEALQRIGKSLPFYVCDTFEGHVVVDPELDPKHKVGVQFRSTSADRVTKYLDAYDFVHVVVGDIQATAGTLPHDREFGFVHIDVDVYPITRFCLEYFAPRVVAGAMLVVDDYGFRTCPGAKKAVDDFVAETPGYRMLHLLTGQAVLIKL